MTTPARPEDEKLPLATTFGYGLQHILAMFGGVIAVPLIIGSAAQLSAADKVLLVSCCLFVGGAATLLQTLGLPYLGSKLPLVQGVSFATVATMLAIIGTDGRDGLRTVYGAVIVASVIGFLLVPIFGRMLRFFPAVVTGSVITVIGLSLMPVAAGWITGQKTTMVNGTATPNPDYLNPGDIGLAFFTLGAIVLLAKSRKLARMAILLGLVIGTLVAAAFGKVSTSAIGSAGIVAVPQPFAFGMPLFEIGAIVSMTIAILVIMVETTADVLAVGEVVGTEVDSRRVGDGLRADLASSALSPVFNSFPATAFAQNVGLVAITGIKSRFAVAAGGAVLLVLGLSPIASAVVGMIPTAVLGGAGIALFGTVAASGIRTLGKVAYDGTNNLIVVAIAIGAGLIPVVKTDFWHRFPSWFETIFHSGISTTAIVAVVLNIVFNMIGGGRKAGSTLATAPALQVTDVEMRVLAEGGAFESGQVVRVRPVKEPERD
ncbi:nucleobase:cation symporter-2 family protein [Nocardia sp. NPDC058640]|uniref:nucleobase:cation symporter-2 family protein n=1 Tax=Nocardia sp. NPDC058640 TaxID=3346571 RepID=UPI00365BA0E9